MIPSTNGCTHPDPMWHLASTDEADGWQCLTCGFPLGFRPDLDRSHTYEKIYAILTDLHEADFVYVSNGEMGEHVCRDVVTQCQYTNKYDQQSIIVFLCLQDDMEHAEYWQKQATAWLQRRADGKDEPQTEELKKAGWPLLFGDV